MRTHLRTLIVTAASLAVSLLILAGSSDRLTRVAFAQQDEGPFADLSVTKSGSPDTVAADADLTYTIQVTNVGPDAADGAALDDTLPAGTTFASLGAPAGWSCATPNVGDTGSVNCTRDAGLAVGVTQTFTLVVHVDSEVSPGTFINNTATVSSATTDPNDENNSSTASNFVGAASADMGVTQTVNSETVVAGRDIVYNIHVTNTGPNAAVNAFLSDTLQGTLTFVSLVAPAGSNCTTPAPGDGGTINCTRASFPAVAADFTLVVHVPADTPEGTTFDNAVQVGADTPDPNDENNSAFTSVVATSCLAGASVVTNADAGTGSLRQAITDVCPGGAIAFDITQVVSPITLTSGELLIDKDLTIQGPGANLLTVTRDASAPAFRVFEVNGAGAGPTVNISGLTLSGGRAAGNGGAVLQVNGTLTVSDSHVTGNHADADGGGVFGGGTLNLSRTTVSGNTAGRHGGGVEALGDTSVANSTVVNNSAQQEGGGIGTSDAAADIDVNVESSTVSGNTAASGGGFYLKATPNKYNFKNTILSGNTAGVNGNDADNSGTLTSQGYNITGFLQSNPGAALTVLPSDQTSTAPGLALDGSNKPLLADNGGAIPTVRPLPASPAIDKGNSFGLTTDQRGFTRPVDLSDSAYPDAADGDAADAGAVEVNYSFTATAGAPQSTTVNTNFATQLQVTLTESGRPVSGVTVTFTAPTNGASATFPSSNTATTDSNGRASVAVKANTVAGAYDVTATAGPLDASFSLTNNAAAPASVIALSGGGQSAVPGTTFASPLRAKVLDAFGNAVPGVTVTFTAPANGASGTFTGGVKSANANTDSSGIADAPAFTANTTSGTYDVTASVTGVATPATFSLTNLPPGTIQFASATFQRDENGGTAVITVTRSGGSAGATTVNFSTSNGTAAGGPSCEAGVDEVNATGTLSWADGDSSDKTFAVTICDDSLNEPDETAGLALSSVTGLATLGSQTTATLDITDNDPGGGVIEFETALFAVAERGSQRSGIAVRRTGDTTRAATVEYTTGDGSIQSVAVPCSATTGAALQRCDYTHTAGTISFAAGETLKTFSVPVNDDSYVEGPETTTLVLSNPGGGAVLGAQSSSTLQIDDDVEESQSNPIDGTSFFARQNYHDFLSREPDDAGLAFWTNNVESCGTGIGATQCREMKRVDTSAAFFLSIEFQQTGYFVYLTRKAAFGNLPGAPVPVRLLPFLRDTQEIGRGAVVGQDAWQQQLEANKQAFLLAFVGGEEFRALYPAQASAAAFVNLLDANAGGVLDSNEKTALISELSPSPSDPALRADVLRKVADDGDFVQREFSRAFVLMQYFGYLRRDPDAAPNSDFTGYNFWLSKLDSFGGDYRRAEMVKAFINSAEYRQRFGQQ